MAADHAIKNRAELFRTLSDSGLFSGTELTNIKNAEPEKAAEQIEAAVDLSGMSRSDLLSVLKTKPSLSAKKVTVSIDADAGEEVEVTSPQAAEPEATEMMDEDEEPQPKGLNRRTFTKESKAAGGRLAAAVGSGRAPGFGNRISGSKAAYERAVRDGGAYKGHRPPMADAEVAEAFGAWARLSIMDGLDYDQKDNDRAIVGNVKDLGTSPNNLGGATVPLLFENELITNRTRNSAITRACGVKPLQTGQLSTPRLIDDVTVSVVGENVADSDQDKPEFDNVDLYPREVRGLVRISNALLTDSAIDIVGAVGDSFARAYGKFEDRNFLLARSAGVTSPSFQGILDKIGSTTTNDTALSSAWSDMTVSDIQTTIGLVSDRSWDSSERLGFICSRPFYDSNMERFAVSAGGNTGDSVYRGFRGGSLPFDADAMWNGYPVWFSSLMPRTYSADQASLLFGAFDAACKIGVVSGSEQMMTSEHRYFENNQIAVRVVKRIAFNAHDVNDTSDADTGSMVVAQQD